jgi:hypothetical protein
MRTLVIGLVACLALTGCGGDSDPLAVEVDSARSRWEAAGISSYEYTIEWAPCLCPAPRHGRVQVTDGVVTAVELLEERGDVSWAREQLTKTIDDLFGWLERFTTESSERGEFLLTFDPETGIPLDVSGDPIAGALDDEFGWTITDFAETG